MTISPENNPVLQSLVAVLAILQPSWDAEEILTQYVRNLQRRFEAAQFARYEGYIRPDASTVLSHRLEKETQAITDNLLDKPRTAMIFRAALQEWHSQIAYEAPSGYAQSLLKALRHSPKVAAKKAPAHYFGKESTSQIGDDCYTSLLGRARLDAEAYTN